MSPSCRSRLTRLFSQVSVCLALAAGAANASDGLVAKAPDTLWLGLHPRVTLLTQPLAPWWQARFGDTTSPALRGIQSGSLVGDYYFAQPWYGRFRASGGLWINQPAGSGEGWAPAPYLALGYSSPARWAGFSFSADLGLAAESSSTANAGLGRALLGVQGAENSRRELRLSPVLQLGVRYAF